MVREKFIRSPVDTGARVILVRHGATELNENGRFISSTDIPLSTKGKIEARETARILETVAIDVIISSPSKRALETAAAISTAKKHCVRSDDRLREIFLGPFEGFTSTELLSETHAHNQSYKRWRDPSLRELPTGAESYLSASERAKAIFQELLLSNNTSLIVSHGIFLRVMIATCVFGLHPNAYRCFRLETGQFAVVEEHDRLLRLSSLGASDIL